MPNARLIKSETNVLDGLVNAFYRLTCWTDIHVPSLQRPLVRPEGATSAVVIVVLSCCPQWSCGSWVWCCSCRWFYYMVLMQILLLVLVVLLQLPLGFLMVLMWVLLLVLAGWCCCSCCWWWGACCHCHVACCPATPVAPIAPVPIAPIAPVPVVLDAPVAIVGGPAAALLFFYVSMQFVDAQCLSINVSAYSQPSSSSSLPIFTSEIVRISLSAQASSTFKLQSPCLVLSSSTPFLPGFLRPLWMPRQQMCSTLTRCGVVVVVWCGWYVECSRDQLYWVYVWYSVVPNRTLISPPPGGCRKVSHLKQEDKQASEVRASTLYMVEPHIMSEATPSFLYA